MSSEASPASGPRLRARWYGRSVVGCVRKNNEDSLAAGTLSAGADVQAARPAEGSIEGAGGLDRPGALLAVADGMGGANAGEVASQMAVSILSEVMLRRIANDLASDADQDAIRALLVRVVELANERIREDGGRNPDRRGMGTTLTAMWIYDDVGQIAHVGDSRAYLFRKGRLSRLTKDQSLVEKLLEDKIISPEEAETMGGKNIILQALGSEEDLDVAHPSSGLRAGDTLLLCTDGLTTVVPDAEIEEGLRQGGDLEDICGRLIANAEGKGGPDNITVLLCTVENAHQASA
jgi:serine/threonine protein phosphatase PrpC